MNQKVLKVLSLSLAAVVAAPFVSVLASCSKDKKSGNRNDDEVLVFSSGEFDGVFNPFFSTSAYDSTIAGQTQIGMMGSDENGKNVTYGVNEPVVALDFNETMYSDKNATQVTSEGSEDGITVYQIVLKNGIKFSDGEPLTAHDVLFNMYVYLDLVYSGSSTMYSTKIQGLSAYQYQDPNITDGRAEQLEDSFQAAASQRASIIANYVLDENWQSLVPSYVAQCKTFGVDVTYGEEEIKADIARIKDWWKEELGSDWTANTGDLESYQKEYPFTKAWQIYFFVEGLISVETETAANGTQVEKKDANGKYVIDWAGVDPDDDYTKEQAIDYVYSAFLASEEYIATILYGWQTGSNAITTFANEIKGSYLDTKIGADGKPSVPNISGIKILPATQFKGSTQYSDEYEMLQVTIDGVDPKAKWNFSFTVAPMHYYSTPELTAAALADENYESNFGVARGSDAFMNQIKRRNSVPMGAGIYQAATDSDYTYEWSTDSSKEKESFNKLSEGFVSDNVAHFVRNEYFYTTGGNVNEVYNAKIKHIRYKVVNSNQTMTALEGGQIHFADPSATEANINRVEDKKNGHLDRMVVQTAGYGYIGINAKEVNNIYIRRALMTIFDVSLVQTYYPGDLSSPLYRSYSKTSWVYNEFEGLEAWDPKPYYTYDETFGEAQRLLEEGGCAYKNGKWVDENNQALKFTFTVAGDSFDHPAYQTFLKAKNILNKYGIEAEVVPDARALYKLASGGLAIWAAAWSSTVDPDMYQVYHKQSKATSIKNWGYDWIKANTDTEDYQIVEELSELIELGRKKLDQAERSEIYREASDKVMELAVEFPLYQRSDMYVYNNTVLDETTFYQNPTPYAGPLNKMWQVSFLLK
ncbi:MAG: hypothetical protein IJY62_03865 [Clostridia bacterium]|nr:hypothetical protein [Clostridia bacterium]